MVLQLTVKPYYEVTCPFPSPDGPLSRLNVSLRTTERFLNNVAGRRHTALPEILGREFDVVRSL